MSRPHQSPGEWHGKALNKASNHLTAKDRERKWLWKWSLGGESEIKTGFDRELDYDTSCVGISGSAEQELFVLENTLFILRSMPPQNVSI